MTPTHRLLLVPLLAGMTLLPACGVISGPAEGTPVQTEIAGDSDEARQQARREDGTLFGDAFSFGIGEDDQAQAAPGIAVNAFLWRGALDTVSFMPITEADPFGGTVLTDWFAPPESPGERFKVNVFILERTLTASGVRATVFRQVLDESAGWLDAAVDPSVGRSIEDAILTRARELRVTALALEE